MITYMDRTYCRSDCTNTQCPRYASADVRAGAKDTGLPIAWCDFSGECPAYVGPVEPPQCP